MFYYKLIKLFLLDGVLNSLKIIIAATKNGSDVSKINTVQVKL